MLHALPFTVHLEHGFFNYQPNLFKALARYNSYQSLGTWVGPDWSLSSLVPWEPRLLEFLTLNAKTTHLLVVLQKKLHDTEFCRAHAYRRKGHIADAVFAQELAWRDLFEPGFRHGLLERHISSGNRASTPHRPCQGAHDRRRLRRPLRGSNARE
jgi:hypothetical protein